MKILNNPLLRIFGVLIVIYFGLFRNTNQVDSLGNRLDSKVIKKELSKAKENSQFIIYNLGKVEELKKTNLQLNADQKLFLNKAQDQKVADLTPDQAKSNLAIKPGNSLLPEDLDSASSGDSKQNQPNQIASKLVPSITDLIAGTGEVIACNDQVEVNYQLKLADQSWLQPKFIKVTVGDIEDEPLISMNLLGMKKDGVRLVKFPKAYLNNDQELSYKLTIIKIVKPKPKSGKYHCEK